MQVKLNYKPSDKLRQQFLIITGNRLKDTFVPVDLESLTPEQRAVLVRCGIDYKDSVDLPAAITGVVLVGYGAPKFQTESAPEVDAIPTVEKWLAMAQAAQATMDQYRSQYDAAIAQQKAEKAAKEARRNELQAIYKVMQSEWMPRIKTMTEAEANQPLPEEVRSVEMELRTLDGLTYPKLSEEKSDRWKELNSTRVKAEAEASKAAWVQAHGSDHLKRACAGGYDCTRKYVKERAAFDAPGYTIDIEDDAKWKDRSCPSVAALDEEDAAKAFNLGDVQIVWLTEPAQDRKTTADDYYDDSYSFEPCEAIVIRGYLGKYDLVKAL